MIKIEFCMKTKIIMNSLKLLFKEYWPIVLFSSIVTCGAFKLNNSICIAITTSLLTFFLTTWINYYNEMSRKIKLKQYFQKSISICATVILENFIDQNKILTNFNGKEPAIKKFYNSKNFSDFVELKDYNFAPDKTLFNNDNKNFWQIIVDTYFRLNEIKGVDEKYLSLANKLVDNFQNHIKPINNVSSEDKHKDTTKETVKNLCMIINFNKNIDC